jgi:mannose-6-phosphate isomerase-like protein (cupin superfamily)
LQLIQSMKPLFATGIAVMLVAGLGAQTRAPQKRPPQPRRPPTETQIIVRDQNGMALQGARIAVSGSMTRQATTGADGTAALAALADGPYRLRFERDGFITLERELTMKGGQPGIIDVVLSAASPPPAARQPTATPAPAPASASAGASAEPANVSIPAFLDKNFIGLRDPLKESVLGCTAGGTTRLLQLRDPLAGHVHPNLDEVLYVVAGDGAVRIGDQTTAVSPGSLTVIPRGVPHAIERRGKNPLVVISTLAGGPCQTGAASR